MMMVFSVSSLEVDIAGNIRSSTHRASADVGNRWSDIGLSVSPDPDVRSGHSFGQLIPSKVKGKDVDVCMHLVIYLENLRWLSSLGVRTRRHRLHQTLT
jgi:hypothetical protein